MSYHDRLEATLDEMAPDRDNTTLDVRESLGEGFAEPWAQTYASMLLDEWIKRGLSNRRRYLTSRDKLRSKLAGKNTVLINVKKPEPKPPLKLEVEVKKVSRDNLWWRTNEDDR